MKGPGKKKKVFFLLISQYQCRTVGSHCMLRRRLLVPPWGEEMWARGRRKDLLRITLQPAARWHGSVAWQPSAACPSRTRGTSIILQLMKSELFCRSLNSSASLLLSVKRESTVWRGYFLPSTLFILYLCEGGDHPAHSAWRRKRESFGFAQCGFL